MNRPALLLLCAAATATLSPGCAFRPDERTLTIQVPRMKSAACARALEAKLNAAFKRQSVSYIQTVRADPASATVEITYNANSVASLNLLHGIGDAGFDARFGSFSVKGDPAARKKLPPECQ